MFTDIAQHKETKPLMIYFYYPEEDSSDKDILNMIRRCSIMEEIFEDECVRRASAKFHCLKCNFKEDLGELLKKKFKVTIVPKVLFFDARGKKVWQLTSTKSKPDSIAKKMFKIAEISDKMIASSNK